jgi:hypothetical protein
MTQEALKLALEKIATVNAMDYEYQAWAREALREHAMREVQRLGQEIEQCTYPNCDYPCMKLPDCREQDHISDARKMVTEQEPDIYPEEAYEMGLEAIAYYITPPQLEERNFCQRCGKRTKDIHTCTPPQRTWADLTDEEILHRIDTHVGVPSQKYPLDISDLISFARAIEAKLKEKNT